MVGVALLPLLAFAALAALELDAVSGSTAQATQSAILQDQQRSQHDVVKEGAKLLDNRADQVAGLLGTVAEKMKAALAATPAAQTLPEGFQAYQNGRFMGGSGDASSLVVNGNPAPGDGRFVTASAQVLPAMTGVRQQSPEVASVWVTDNRSGALRTVPGFDVPGSISQGRIDMFHPGTRGGADVFGESQQRMSVTSPNWADPDIATGRSQFWTDPYPLLADGSLGVSVWLKVNNASDDGTIVGADILVPSLVDAALSNSSSATYPPNAYPMLLSSSGVILYAGPGLDHDFKVPRDPAGATLLPTTPPANADSATFRSALAGSFSSGNPVTLQTQLSGETKNVFTSQVFAGRWMWARSVPMSDLEPDLKSLTLGLTASIHRLFPVMVLPVLLLLLGLAFIAATLLSRRMELPVRALTDQAVLEERTRLAREIHDTLAQQLTGIVLELEAAGTLLERGSDRARQSVDVAREHARSALQEARRSVWNLRPATLAVTGVTAAISQEVEAWQERTGVTARFRARSVPPRPALQPAAEVALLRIVQEALANISRHSSATAVDVSLRGNDGELVLTVRDNGVGFDAMNGSPRSDSFGLEGMRERANNAGGTLAVVAAPGSGTTVTARIPVVDTPRVADTA